MIRCWGINGQRMRGLCRFLLAVMFVHGHGALRANDISVTNTAFTVNGKVSFDITWKNSWRLNPVNPATPPNNYDAAWIFVKYREAATGLWKHAHLAFGGHTPPNVTQGEFEHGLEHPGQPFDAVGNRVVGVFLQRQNLGSGTFIGNGVELIWPYPQDGLAYGNIDSVKVFAIEMVHVPEAAFHLGSGGLDTGGFYQYPDTMSTYLVSDESEIPVGPVAGNLYYPDTLANWYPNTDTDGTHHWGDGASDPVPAAFPKGYAAFYIMKHELAHQDYVDFLNCLTRVQQARHTGLVNNALLAPGVTNVDFRYVMCYSTSAVNRQAIRCDAVIDPEAPVVFYCDLETTDPGGGPSDGQWVACGNLHWLDLGAYLDWCGLRPMTELEFVKAARGPVAPVPVEYVWGSTIIASSNSIINGGQSDEQSAVPSANAVYNPSSPNGPWRTGIFATANTVTREQAGAGYYGALDLGGNLGEQGVTIGFPSGRAFDGSVGDGELDSLGYANQPTWPGNGYFNGIGVLGGHWATGNSFLRTSDRHTASHVTYTSRPAVNGGRGVRDAP